MPALTAATLDPLATPEHVETALGRSGFDAARVDRLLAQASAAFRTATNQLITKVVDDAVTLDANGSWALLLPELPVLEVQRVVVDGQELGAGDYEWSNKGILKRCGRWPAKYRSVTVTYDHGHDPIPEDIAEAVAERVALAIQCRIGITNVQLGATSYGFDKVGTTQAWVDAVAAYRVAR